MAASVLSRGATMAMWVVCARLLSQRDFGMLMLIHSAAITAGILGACGIGVTTTRFVAELRTSDPLRAGRVIRMSSIITGASGAFFGAIAILYSRAIATHLLGSPDQSVLVSLAAIVVALNASNAHQTGTLAGLEAFKDVARLSLWTGITSAVITIAATQVGGLRGAILGLLVSQAITWCVYHIVVKLRCAEIGIDPTAPHWVREIGVLMEFSLPAALTSMLFAPVAFVLQYWLSRLPDGMAQVALYGAADRWRLVILFLPTSLFQAALPILANLSVEQNGVQFRRIVRANTYLGIGVVIVSATICAVCAPLAMGMFGWNYRGGWKILLMLCISALPQVLNGMLGQAIIIRSMWMRLGFDILLFVVLCTTACILVPRSGASGLAASYLLAFMGVTPLLFLYCRRHQLI